MYTACWSLEALFTAAFSSHLEDAPRCWVLEFPGLSCTAGILILMSGSGKNCIPEWSLNFLCGERDLLKFCMFFLREWFRVRSEGKKRPEWYSDWVSSILDVCVCDRCCCLHLAQIGWVRVQAHLLYYFYWILMFKLSWEPQCWVEEKYRIWMNRQQSELQMKMSGDKLPGLQYHLLCSFSGQSYHQPHVQEGAAGLN